MACFHSVGEEGGQIGKSVVCVRYYLQWTPVNYAFVKLSLLDIKKYVVFLQENRGLTHLNDVDVARPAENPQQLLMVLAE